MPLRDSFGDDAVSESAESASASVAGATDVKPAATGEQPNAAAPAPSAGQAPKAETGEQPGSTTSERPREEQGRFTKDGQADPDGEFVPRGAMLAERRRRQEAEDALAARNAGTPQARREEQPELTDEQVLEAPAKTITEAAKQAEQRTINRFFDYSDFHASKRYADWSELTDELIGECKTNPMLRDEAMRHYSTAPDPGEAIYEFAKNRRELRLAGGLSGYQAKLTAPLQAQIDKLTADLEAATKRNANLSAVPSSLNSTPAASRPTGKDDEPETEESLTSIVQSRRRKA